MDVVFFDASVLFKAAVTRFLLGAAQSGEFRAIWSDLVVEEARRSLLAARSSARGCRTRAEPRTGPRSRRRAVRCGRGSAAADRRRRSPRARCRCEWRGHRTRHEQRASLRSGRSGRGRHRSADPGRVGEVDRDPEPERAHPSRPEDSAGSAGPVRRDPLTGAPRHDGDSHPASRRMSVRRPRRGTPR